MLSELHREFSTKDRTVRTQLLALGSALPVLQMHLGLCTAFTTAASKYQFLELAHPMLERLSRVAQLGHLPRPAYLNNNFKYDYKNEFVRAIRPFINMPTQPQITRDIIYDEHNPQQEVESQFIQVKAEFFSFSFVCLIGRIMWRDCWYLKFHFTYALIRNVTSSSNY